MKHDIIILAAGKGQRMNSTFPKVLNQIGGKSLLKHVIDTCRTLQDTDIYIVHGYQGEQLQEHLQDEPLHWVKQDAQLGTGHAVLQALPQLHDQAQAIILYGDVPLISPKTLECLIQNTPETGIGLITASLYDPHGYGRVVRDASKKITRIVEEKDTNDAERAINEINTGIYCVKVALLKKWLAEITPNNGQREYLLTDIIKLAVRDGAPIQSITVENNDEILGVNDRLQLAHLERCYQKLRVKELMQKGVCVRDPYRVDIRGTIAVEQDVALDINVILEGTVSLGERTTVGAYCILKNVRVGRRVTIHPYTFIEDAIIEDDAIVGPFARIRPGTVLLEKSHVGNFVEIKKSSIGVGSKVNHLSYIGNAVIGKNVNVGAGTITCNYDGVHKHPTNIGDGAFIGSGTQLVAPVSIGAHSYVGAGSTITEDTPADQLTLARARQITVEGWEPPAKESTKKEH